VPLDTVDGMVKLDIGEALEDKLVSPIQKKDKNVINCKKVTMIKFVTDVVDFLIMGQL